MEPPNKKIKPYNSLSPNELELFLPDDIIITILARVPRSYYPFLSLVSKKFRSFIYSTDLFSIRSSFGTTENTVFVRLKLPASENLCWYNLVKNPNNSKHLLVPINYSYDTVHLTSVHFLNSVGYVIGGHDEFSRTVQRFRRKNYSWVQETVPNMNVARKNAVVHLFGEKVYVLGGCNDSETTNWAEVFDIKTRTWKSLMCPPEVLRGYKIYKIRVYNSKLYVWTDTKDYSYDLKRDKWEVLEERLSQSKSWCVVNKILYRLDHHNGFEWYNSESKIWKKVKGLSKLKYEYGIKQSKNMIEIVEYDKKLLVFCDKFEKRGGGGYNRNKKIWCAEIWLRKRKEEMKGYIKWIDEVLTVPSSYDFATCLSTLV